MSLGRRIRVVARGAGRDYRAHMAPSTCGKEVHIARRYAPSTTPCLRRNSFRTAPVANMRQARRVVLLASGEAATRRLAARIARRARAGDVICLHGPLGSGKTTFVQGFARAAGFRGSVASPTFAIARRYRARRWTIHHLDLFRLSVSDLPNLALEEFFDDPRGICLIEWPEIAAAILPEDRLEVVLAHSEAGRSLRFASTGPRSDMLLSSLRPHTSKRRIHRIKSRTRREAHWKHP